MFRKITSNRDPGKTLGSEIKKEFGIYFDHAGKHGRRLMQKYPRQVFMIMVVAILFSGILAFTVMRSPKAPEIMPKPADRQQAVAGIGQIISTASALQTLWGLQKQVDSLLKKKTLSRADSLTLNNGLSQIESLRLLIRKSRPNH
jgi:hypothetical protein